jgi:hypothetical protein
LQADRIDALILDPFVSVHAVHENDNSAIDKVVAAWNHVAEAANVAIHFAFHTTKLAPGHDFTEMNLRGAGAALNKLRYVRVLNRMSEKEAESIGIEKRFARQHLRIDDGGKSNLLPPAEAAQWFRLQSVDLQNADIERDGFEHAKSDLVRVAVPWTYPITDTLDPTDDEIQRVWQEMGDTVWRKMSTSPDGWVGIPIARALGLDLSDELTKKRIAKLVARWASSGVLVVSAPEERDGHGNRREGFVPGQILEAAE